jgi:hypothetical protein
MRSSDRLVGSPWRQSVEQFHEARLVRITHGGFAIWLNPFGMLDPQVFVNLLPKLPVRVDLGRHDNASSVAWDRFYRGLFRVVGRRSYREGAEWPGEGTPKNRTQVLAACMTRGQLDHLATLVFQQHGKQSTLRKGRSRFSHNAHNVRRQAK